MLQKLSPQQIQMIKLLELPTLQLEQRIKQEIEENPVLEEEESPEEEQEAKEVSVEEYFAEDDTPSYKYRVNNFYLPFGRGDIPGESDPTTWIQAPQRTR